MVTKQALVQSDIWQWIWSDFSDIWIWI